MSQNPYGQNDFADELAEATAAQRAQAQVQQILAERAAERAARAIGGDTAPDTTFQPAQPEQVRAPQQPAPPTPVSQPAAPHVAAPPAQPAVQAQPAVAAQAPARPAQRATVAPPSLTPPVAEVPPAAKGKGGQTPQPGTDTVLLDANTLAALLIGDHVHHQIVADWYAGSGSRYATCPFSENSLVRLLVRTKHSASEVGWLLVRLTGDPRHEFWPDALPFSSVPLTAVVGHRQVTDAYLVALARHRGAKLLTLDKGLHALHPDVVQLLEVTEPA